MDVQKFLEHFNGVQQDGLKVTRIEITPANDPGRTITVSRRGDLTWAVTSFGGMAWSKGKDGWVFEMAWSKGKDGWVFEPLPSSRTEEFLADTRFSIVEALTIADEIRNRIEGGQNA